MALDDGRGSTRSQRQVLCPNSLASSWGTVGAPEHLERKGRWEVCRCFAAPLQDVCPPCIQFTLRMRAHTYTKVLVSPLSSYAPHSLPPLPSSSLSLSLSHTHTHTAQTHQAHMHTHAPTVERATTTGPGLSCCLHPLPPPCSGSTSPIENLALLASLWRASLRDLSGAAFGVGLATYFSLHPIILLVRPKNLPLVWCGKGYAVQAAPHSSC